MKPWAAVIGDPIDHSLSPVLHKKAYEILGLDWDFRRYRVNSDEFAGFLSNLESGCKGLAVTMPLKNMVQHHVDNTDGLAKLLRSANTIVPAGGLRAGFNTDVHGITAALKSKVPAFERDEWRPVVIGTGATASSALAALATLGYRDTWLVGRNFSGDGNAFMSANRIGVRTDTIPLRIQDRVQEVIDRAPITISTIPADATTELASLISPRSDAVLLDVTYSSHLAPLEDSFRSAGATVVSPLVMLVHQGIAQIKLMTNREVPFEPIYEAVVNAVR